MTATLNTEDTATIDDVAQLAHLSPRDVERALKDPDSVPADTLAVIREAVQEVGYVPPKRPRPRRRQETDGRPRTRSGLLILDARPLLEEGRQQVRDELAGARRLIERAVDRGKLVAAWRFLASEAARIAKATDAEVEPLRVRRDQAMLSLYLLDGVRGVDKAAGIAPTTFYEMRQKARDDQAPIPHVEGARDVIAEIAPRVHVLNGRREEASELQRRAALTLDDLGVPVPEIIGILGVSEGRFWQWHASKARPEVQRARSVKRASRRDPLWAALDAPGLKGSRRSVAAIDVPSRTYRGLQRNGVRTVGQVAALSENDLRGMPEIGEAAIKHIKAALKRVSG